MGSPVQVTIPKVLAYCSHCKLLGPYTAGVIISIVEIEKVSILHRWDSIFEKQPSFSSQPVFFFPDAQTWTSWPPPCKVSTPPPSHTLYLEFPTSLLLIVSELTSTVPFRFIFRLARLLKLILETQEPCRYALWNTISRLKKMAQQLRALVALPGGQSSCLSTHVRCFTPFVIQAAGSLTSSFDLWAKVYTSYPCMCTQLHTNFKKEKCFPMFQLWEMAP